MRPREILKSRVSDMPDFLRFGGEILWMERVRNEEKIDEIR
jgi:hypothetical protein